MEKYEVTRSGSEEGEIFDSLATAMAYFKTLVNRAKGIGLKETYKLWQGVDQGIDGKLKYRHLILEETPRFLGDLDDDDVEVLKMALPVYARYMKGLILKWRQEDGDGNEQTAVVIDEATRNRDRAIEIFQMLVKR